MLILATIGSGMGAGAEEVGGAARLVEPADLQLQVKAAFLPKLASFVDWPAGAFPGAETPIVLGIVGEDPFGPEFEAALKLQNAKGRPFLLRRFRDPMELAACQMLFVCPSEKARWPEILAALKNRPTLTIGDGDQFIEAGGMINFVKEEGKIRFQINTDASERAGLRISAKLLQVSRVYRGAKWAK